MSNTHSRLALPAVALTGFGLILQACSSGSGGSSVGNADGIAPTARAQVLNGGTNNKFREGSEVLLSGKDSEDADGPLLAWSWEQTAGPSVQLIERNAVAVSFTAPEVTEETSLAFELTVEDSNRDTGSTSVEVTVVPAKDANKFLSLDVRGAARDTFDDFQVVAALAEGASTDSMPKPFTLSALAYLVYPPRSNPNITCAVDTSEFATGIPASTASGCLVEFLEDLTPFELPGGGTGIAGEWPANVPVVVRPGGATADQIASEWWNPHFTLSVPRLDVDDFNQQFVESGERGRFLEQFNTQESRIFLVFELTAPQNQQDATLIVNDLESTPIVIPSQVTPKTAQAQAKITANDGTGLPTRVVIPNETVLGAITGRESALTAEVYYRTVDPNGTRMTLNAWLQQAGFTDENGKLLPEATAGDGEFAHAIYLNNYDLGLGRDMHSRTDEFGNVYTFVVNYATLEGAIRRNDPIVTVVMEYSPLGDAADPTEKFVKFFTYVDDGGGDSRRVGSMNFDGRGELFTPGNCMACHGGAKPPGVSELIFDATCGDRSAPMCYAWPATNRDGADIADGNLKATFLPWDLDSFLFADNDPAITDAPDRFDGVSLFDRLARDHGDYSRGVQEAQLKKLNQAAHTTYCDAAQDPNCRTDSPRRLVEHWYGGVDQDGNLIAATFDDTSVPAGWQNDELVPDPSNPNATVANPSDAEDLYETVYARHCRMCHTNVLEETLRFDTYQKLIALTPQVEDQVFQRGTMPAARLTMDRLWAPQDDREVPAHILARHLGVSEEEATGPAPFVNIAQPESAIVPRRASVRLSARDSAFVDVFGWQLAYEPVPELVGSPGVMVYDPTLVGNGTPNVAFVAEHPGTYTVNVVINDPDPGLPLPEGFADTESVMVQNFVPLACSDAAATEPGGDPVSIPFLENDRFTLAGSGADCSATDNVPIADASDIPLTYAFSSAFDANGEFTTANGGTFTLDTGAACEVGSAAGCDDDVILYTPNDSGDSYFDSVTYRITDTDGELSGFGTIGVEVTADLEVNAQAAANVLSEATRLLTLSISGGATVGPGESRYTVTLTNAPDRGTISRDGMPVPQGGSFQADGGVLLTYVSNDFETGDESIQFTVTDADMSLGAGSFNFEVLPRAPFRNLGNLVAGQSAVMDQWTSTADGKQNCLTAGCHNAAGVAGPRFNMEATDLAVYAALTQGTSTDSLGSVKVVAGTLQRQNNPDSSIILCYPSGAACAVDPVGTPHDGGLALPTDSFSYGVIRRWIQENAQFND